MTSDWGPQARRFGLRLLLFLFYLAGPSSRLAGVESGTAAHHASRIVVKPLKDRWQPALDDLHQQLGSRVIRVLGRQGQVQTLSLPDTLSVEEAVQRYRASGLVEFAEPDYLVRAASTLPNDPWFQNGALWPLNNYGQQSGVADADIDAPEAWDVTHSGSGVVVAIVDSGIRTTHLDLAHNLWIDPANGSHGTNALAGGADLTDENGHGTHLAGIIGAVGNNTRGGVGVAWDVRIMACKFLDGAGQGYNSDAAACIEFAREHGAKIINLSWGGPVYSQTLSNAIHSAAAEGIVFVAGAGNNGWDTDLQPYYPASLDLVNLVAVAASTRFDAVWLGSDYGLTRVDLFAPGSEVVSTSAAGDDAYETKNGTSIAAAYVSGALALLREQMPQASCSEVIDRLLRSTDRGPAFNGKCVTGGRLNLRRALDQPRLSLVRGPCDSCDEVGHELQWHVAVEGITGHRYVLEGSRDLADWLPLWTNLVSTAQIWTWADATSTLLPQRFYRALPAP